MIRCHSSNHMCRYFRSNHSAQPLSTSDHWAAPSVETKSAMSTTIPLRCSCRLSPAACRPTADRTVHMLSPDEGAIGR